MHGGCRDGKVWKEGLADDCGEELLLLNAEHLNSVNKATVKELYDGMKQAAPP